MINYFENQEIDKQKWDETISISPNGMIYGYSWYLDIVSPGWAALISDDYESMMPLTFRRKYFVNYLYQPFFTQQLGVFSKSRFSNDLVNKFISSIPEKFKFIEINLNQESKFESPLFEIKALPNFILDINRTFDLISKGYHENLKRNIKKAHSRNLTISSKATIIEVIDMFRQNRGRGIDQLLTTDYQMFEMLVHEAAKHQMVQIRLVGDENGIPCAGAIFFESHGSGIFIFSATTDKGKEVSAMPLLIDSYIKEKAGKLKTLDFEGSKDPDLARFYKSFGSQENVYLQIKNNRLPVPWRWIKK